MRPTPHLLIAFLFVSPQTFKHIIMRADGKVERSWKLIDFLQRFTHLINWQGDRFQMFADKISLTEIRLTI